MVDPGRAPTCDQNFHLSDRLTHFDELSEGIDGNQEARPLDAFDMVRTQQLVSHDRMHYQSCGWRSHDAIMNLSGADAK